MSPAAGREQELKFRVPAARLPAVRQEMTRATASTRRTPLHAVYFDTAERDLARAGLSWRLRREGRHWRQTLKADLDQPGDRWEHEVPRGQAVLDRQAHQGTPAGQRLQTVLQDIEQRGRALQALASTRIQRLSRTVRTRGARVEVALDQGVIVSGSTELPVCEMEFELRSGSFACMLALVRRWRDRFDLQWDPRSKAARGDSLATGQGPAPVRRARRADIARRASVDEAFATVVDECLAQITANMMCLLEGQASQRADAVHQLRVGIRRLRSGCRVFRGWVEPPPAELTDELSNLFRALGRIRERDVWSANLSTVLEQAQLPPLVLETDPSPWDAASLVATAGVQRALLAWIGWRHGQPVQPGPPTIDTEPPKPRSSARKALPAMALQRLKRWHKNLVAMALQGPDLTDANLHNLRKRIKRQRYAAEFFEPLLGLRHLRRYVAQLAPLQEALGEFNDLLTAREVLRSLSQKQQSAAFALGWVTARAALQREAIAAACQRFTDQPKPQDLWRR